MASKFAAGWARFIPMIGYHHIMMMVAAVAIVFLSILLAGCTSSNGLSNVYLLSLQYTNISSLAKADGAQVSTAIQEAVTNASRAGSGTTLEVRAGYMGLCMTQGDEDRICSSSARALASILKAEKKSVEIGNVTTEYSPDPLNLVMMANEFREKIVFDGLLFITIALTFACFLLLGTFPGWHEKVSDTGSEVEVKPFPARPVVGACLFTIGPAFGFALISVLWQHINSSSTASMVETLTYGAVAGHVGAAAMAFGWIAVGLVATVGLGLFIMKLSINLIMALTEEDESDYDED
ncbi:uncharacterized protein N7459_004153 [Penicillium hispanicum]|uniref:uncharacterized protein n=1 Tax=Penicillium hispanicum TaxID=1080232 RepID=UPI0025413414|nr:uncharacterized protein N7459_004153 [Penicillium hispanicum]KAJ5584353.1 hypothetical protein N7459_004153 [Penicillium hispanicum]